MTAQQRTVTYWLNVLAGTVNASDVPQLADVAAANLYAGTSGLDLVGALNAKAGRSGLELRAVCLLLSELAVDEDEATALEALSNLASFSDDYADDYARVI